MPGTRTAKCCDCGERTTVGTAMPAEGYSYMRCRPCHTALVEANARWLAKGNRGCRQGLTVLSELMGGIQ